jgi:hypothetical protein
MATARDETVCGYKNYETFHVAMFLSNNRPMYEAARRLAQAAVNHFPDVADRNELSGCSWLDLADRLETMVEQHYLKIDERELRQRTDTDRLAFALMTAALGRVDWRELAEEWINTVEEG